MKNKTIILAITIIIIMVISVGVGATVSVLNSTKPTTAEQLKAEYYINSNMWQSLSYGGFEDPYKVYLEEYLVTDGFDAGFALWKTTNFIFNPNEIIEGVTENDILSEKGFYEAILFEIFYEPQRESSYLDKLNSITKKSNASVYKDIKNAYDSVFTYGSYPSDNELLSDDELFRLRMAVYEQGGTEYIDLFGGVESFNKVVEGAKCVDDFVEKIGIVKAFGEVSQSRINVLQEMYDNCDDNAQLKAALGEMLAYYGSNFSTEYIIAQGIYDLALPKLIDEVSKKLWGDVVAELGGGWVKLAYTVGKAASNAWLSTDAYYESFMEMNSLREVETLADSVGKQAYSDYQSNPNENNAVKFNACMDIRMNIHDLGYDYAIKYLNQQQDVGINHVAQALGYHGINYDGIISNLKSEKKNLSTKYEVSEVLLDELGAQGSEGHDKVYDSYYLSIEEQTEFDVYLELCADMQSVMEQITSLKMRCNDSVVANTSCTIGPAVIKALGFNNTYIMCNGDMQLGAITKMESEEDVLHVKGDFTVGNYHNNDRSVMTAGQVKLEGDLYYYSIDLSDGLVNDGYLPTGTCKTVFCGEGLQTVKGYAHYLDRSGVNLGAVDIQCSQFTMNVNSSSYPDMKLVGDANIDYEGQIQVDNLELNGHKLKTKGSVISKETIYAGNDSDITAEKGINAQAVIAKDETSSFGGPLVARTMQFDGAQVMCNGDVQLGAITKMESEEDVLHVKGDFTVGSVSASSNINAGTIELCGNLSFGSSGNFQPIGTCKIVFCGEGSQNVSGSSSRIKCLKNIINVHEMENELTSSYPFSGTYIWDPSYKTGDRYMELATITDNYKTGYEYTGNTISVDLVVNYGGILLEKDVDYFVECSNNTELGTAVAKISGLGCYKNSQNLEYKIVPASIEKASVADVLSQTYTGEAITPDIALEYNGQTLKKGTDYAVSYENNINVGKGLINVKGVGNFTGNTTIEFDIVPDDSISEEALEISIINNISDIPDVLTAYYDNPKDIIQTLPVKVKGILNSGRETELDISWNCDEYDKKPSASNVFKWTVSSDTYAIKDNIQTSGEVIIINKAISSVTIGAKDVTVDYCESVDVADLFDIDSNAGAATYEIINGGTGKGLLDGTTLNVETPGSFIIKVSTDENGNYDVGEAVATLTVSLPKINEVFLPQLKSDVLEKYYSDASSVIETLPDTVLVNTDLGKKEMTIKWFCENYNTDPNAENTFLWVINPKEYVDYDVNDITLEGEIKLFNKDTTDISSLDIVLSDRSYIYNGQEQIPIVEYNNLVKDIDYTVVCKNNINVGTATAIISGKGNYTGNVSRTFRINPANISSASLSTTVYTYSGTVKTPMVTVNADGLLAASKITKDTSNIDVTYSSGRKNVGAYKVTVKGIGNFTGTLNKTFTINPKGTSISKLYRAKKAFTVKWKKQSTKMATSTITGYQIRYSTSSKMTSPKYKTVKGYKYTSKKITKLKAKKKYYVQVRTYKTVSGKNYYSSWSGVKSVTTK